MIRVEYSLSKKHDNSGAGTGSDICEMLFSTPELIRRPPVKYPRSEVLSKDMRYCLMAKRWHYMIFGASSHNSHCGSLGIAKSAIPDKPKVGIKHACFFRSPT